MKLLLITILTIILYSVSVSAAAGVDNIDTINLGSVTLGTNVSSTFTLTNNGDVNLSNVQFIFSNNIISLSTNKTDFDLNITGITSEDITFNLAIPSTYSTGNLTLGTVNLVSTGLPNKVLFTVKAIVEGGLEIEDLDIILTTRIKRGSGGTYRSETATDVDVKDGKSLDFDEENVGPGSELKFDFDIENTFKQSEKIDIEDIVITITIEDIDDGGDIEEESVEFDADSGSNVDVDVYLYLPLSVGVGKYDVIIEIEGKDKDDNIHTIEYNLELTVKKEGRDIIVTRASVFPDTIKCSGQAIITATMKNLGSKIEKEAQLEVLNSDLRINFLRKDIEMDDDPFDDDNEYSKTIPVLVVRGTAAGTYPIVVNSYLNPESLWDTKTANLVVVACNTPVEEVIEEEVEEEAEETVEEVEEIVEVVVEEVEEEVTEGVQVPVLKPATTTELPLTKRTEFWVFIALFNVAVIAFVAFLAIKVVGKSGSNKKMK